MWSCRSIYRHTASLDVWHLWQKGVKLPLQYISPRHTCRRWSLSAGILNLFHLKKQTCRLEQQWQAVWSHCERKCNCPATRVLLFRGCSYGMHHVCSATCMQCNMYGQKLCHKSFGADLGGHAAERPEEQPGPDAERPQRAAGATPQPASALPSPPPGPQCSPRTLQASSRYCPDWSLAGPMLSHDTASHQPCFKILSWLVCSWSTQAQGYTATAQNPLKFAWT